LAHERICSATGTSVAEAWASEKRCLTRLPETLPEPLPEPFDVVAVRVVGLDALVSFEGRQYSVPFRFAGERVEVRGCAGKIQVVKDCAVIASHPRATAAGPVGFEDPGPGPLTCRAAFDLSLCRLGGGGPMNAPKPKLDIDTTRERLAVLGCSHTAEHLDQGLSDAVRQEIAPHAFLDLLLETELSGHEARRVKTSLKLSNLPTGQTLENFDFAFQPAIERSRIDTLATCAWVRTAETVLIQGPPGVGKTHLCVGLGIRAVEQGFSVQYFRFDELMTALKIDAGLPPAQLKRRKYMSTALLLIDELGFEPMTRQEASLFFRLVTMQPTSAGPSAAVPSLMFSPGSLRALAGLVATLRDAPAPVPEARHAIDPQPIPRAALERPPARDAAERGPAVDRAAAAAAPGDAGAKRRARGAMP
jgi:DNA replication protein DnaC